MGFKICSIASGSTGNCTYVATDKTALLIDVGIPVTRAELCLKALGVKETAAVLVTHSHYDHISNVALFSRRNGVKVYCHHKSTEALKKKGSFDETLLCEFSEGDFIVGDITVSPFAVSHDVPCVGFVLSHGSRRIGITTDLGHAGGAVLGKLSGCNLVMIESNHDEGMLRANREYSHYLKERILSDSGHLSNSACAAACVKLAATGVKQFILAHLSQENNYPELAFETTSSALKDAGYYDIGVEVAPAQKPSGMFEIF